MAPNEHLTRSAGHACARCKSSPTITEFSNVGFLYYFILNNPVSLEPESRRVALLSVRDRMPMHLGGPSRTPAVDEVSKCLPNYEILCDTPQPPKKDALLTWVVSRTRSSATLVTSIMVPSCPLSQSLYTPAPVFPATILIDSGRPERSLPPCLFWPRASSSCPRLLGAAQACPLPVTCTASPQAACTLEQLFWCEDCCLLP